MTKNFLNFSLLLFLLLFLIGCPVYDPPNSGPSIFYNCSDEAIYVYHSKNGKLEIEPKLNLFEFKKEEFMFKNLSCDNLLKSPDYRINAYEEKEVNNITQYLRNISSDSLYFFFIKEKTMREFAWQDIVERQLFESYVSISMANYNDLHRVVTYIPNK
jgi:hypothetical protein